MIAKMVKETIIWMLVGAMAMIAGIATEYMAKMPNTDYTSWFIMSLVALLFFVIGVVEVIKAIKEMIHGLKIIEKGTRYTARVIDYADNMKSVRVNEVPLLDVIVEMVDENGIYRRFEINTFTRNERQFPLDLLVEIAVYNDEAMMTRILTEQEMIHYAKQANTGNKSSKHTLMQTCPTDFRSYSRKEQKK
jgi:hypothetical protein